LLRRRRALAGFVPWIPLGAWHGRTVRSVRGHPAQSMAAAVTGVAVVAVVVAVIVSAVVSASPGPPRPASAPSAASPPTTASSPLTGPDGPVLPDAGKLADLAGRTVRARGVRVLAVPADEGFWVGEGPGRRVWVQLRTHAESPVSVRAGQRLTFTAVVVRNDTGFVRRARVPGADARELARQGAHLEVAPRDVSGAGGSPGG